MTTSLQMLAVAPQRLNPFDLFLDADIIVQAVIIGLVLASIWVWTIIISFTLRMRKLEWRSNEFEADFQELEEFDNEVSGPELKGLPPARVAASGILEWNRSTRHPPFDRDGARQRLAGAMESQIAQEVEQLVSRLGFLATTGSVAPFVGLFGTVWGIMNSFFQIGVQGSSSLAVVAPGIAEALFATAIGLFAAIPAVIAYNRFSDRVNRYEARLQRFADRFHAELSRKLDKA